jgi:hypothetical protein
MCSSEHPAQFHGRPELVKKLTQELQQERRIPKKREPGS